MFLPLLESQASSSSEADRHVAINLTLSHSVSWSSSLANSFHSGVTETESDPHSGEFATAALVNLFMCLHPLKQGMCEDLEQYIHTYTVYI